MKKRILTLLLAVCMAASLLTVPAGAAASGFADVADTTLSADVECLRLLGVLDGYADGSFRPATVLNRAQFCKMATYVMNASDELGKYRAVTVFPDVKPSHWAAAYINLASKGKGVILGFADGKFHPESNVTAGQAVTILMRLLGYKDEDVGAIWPDGYMAEAGIAGLTDGLSLSGSAPLTRGQAAKLFANLLRCELKGDSKTFGASIAANPVENVLLISSTAKGADGQETAMQVGDGATYQMANKLSNGALNGRMGTLLLDKNNKVLTFVPDQESGSRTVTVAEATASYLLDTNGGRYAVPSTVKVYRGGKEDVWSTAYAWLTPGVSVTLYLGDGGGVEYIYAGGITASQAVVVYERGSTAGLSALTNGSTSYTIVKDGIRATAAALERYDVVTYSTATNTLEVCNTRITGIYESCAPSASEPTEVTVMGHSFQVLPSAQPDLKDLKLGESITLLLTADNQVAGALEPTSAARANAIGIAKVSGSSATVELLCGITVSGTFSGSADRDGQMVSVASPKKGALGLSRLTGGVTGNLDVAARKLGSKALAENVVIYQEESGSLTAKALSQLSDVTIPSDQIAYARTNWKDEVNLVVLGARSATSAYIYGRAIVNQNSVQGTWHPNPGAEDEDPEDGVNGYYDTKVTTTLAVEYGDGRRTDAIKGSYSVRNGDYVRVSMSADGSRFASITQLTKIINVSNSVWVGESAVTVSGRTYTVSGAVVCYNKSLQKWVTLDEAHAFANSCTIYVDAGGVIRAIEVSQ